jgi:hypothetical protein
MAALMEFGRAGWLFALFSEEVSAHRGELVSEIAGSLPSGSDRRRARVYLRRVLRQTGLLFGTPAEGPARKRSDSAEETLLWAVIRSFARIALDLAVILKAPPAPREEQLLLLFAAIVGEPLPRGDSPLPANLWSKVESELGRRMTRFSGDPAYRLLLHNATTYPEVRVFGRQAIQLFAQGQLTAAAIQRRHDFAAREKAILIEALIGLASIARPPSALARRALLRQLDQLALPPEMISQLRRRVQELFEKGPSMSVILQRVKGADHRRFILEQMILASLAGGHRTAREVGFIEQLAGLLKISQDELARIQVELAEFYAQNRSVVDVFTISPGAGAMGEELVHSIQRVVEKNFQRFLREVRETGELSVLLTRAARGQKLTLEERRKVRTQLIDVAKAIPALAIFAAPGGVLLLIALSKVLPFKILPSAFQDEEPPRSETEDTKQVDA